MPQRDCGCPGLVTPTLDELLAVAQHKPLPRVRVRDRRPPPARLGATLKGWMAWRLVDRKGREVAGGEGPNLILDQGLDLIASVQLRTSSATPGDAGQFPIIAYCAVGTDSTSPDPSQTGLGAEVARTNTTFASDAIARPANGVYQLTKSIEFDYNQANGNLTEWGFSDASSVGANLFNRALFTDEEGDPDPVTKTDQEKLRIVYTLEIALSPVVMTPASFEVTGVGVVNGDYTLLGRAELGTVTDRRRQPDLRLFSALARGSLGTVYGASAWASIASARTYPDEDLSGTTYATDINAHIDGDNQVARDVTTNPRDAYVPGSFQRTGGAWRWDTDYGNVNPIKGIVLCGSSDNAGGGIAGYVGYAFDFDTEDEFSKDNEHRLDIGVPTVTWGRAA